MPDRVIHVYVKDAKDRLIPGAAISYEIDGTPAGDVPNSDGHADFQIEDHSSRIRVSATFQNNTQVVLLAQSQDEYTSSVITGHG